MFLKCSVLASTYTVLPSQLTIYFQYISNYLGLGWEKDSS